MKRNKFIKHLCDNNCILLRNHDIYKNIDNNNWTAVPRHPDIRENTCKSICKQLGIPVI